MAAPMVKTSSQGIYKRGSRYVVVFRGPDKKQRKRSARTLAAARELRATLVADVGRGEYRDTSKAPFDEYARTWIDTYTGRTAKGLREETRKEYRRQIEQRAIPHFGGTPLNAVTPRNIKEYVAKVQAETVRAEDTKRPVSSNTVRLALAPVRALFATALEDGDVRLNPCTGVRIPRPSTVDVDEQETRAKALTEQQIGQLLGHVPEHRRELFEFVAITGMRISEAIAVRKRDLDFGRKVVHVRQRAYQGRLDAPKSKYGRRTIPLPPYMAQALWRRLAIASPDSLVFPGAKGELLHSSTTLRALKDAGKKAGIPDVTQHQLRHSCASILFAKGWNAVQVQRFLGHHSAAFTLATYVHLLGEELPESPFDGGFKVATQVATSPTETDLNETQAVEAATA